MINSINPWDIQGKVVVDEPNVSVEVVSVSAQQNISVITMIDQGEFHMASRSSNVVLVLQGSGSLADQQDQIALMPGNVITVDSGTDLIIRNHMNFPLILLSISST